MPSIAYYVSGHGFGHAVRSAEIIRALVDSDPKMFVHVRTSAPALLFEHLPSSNVLVHPVEVDAGVVEKNGSLQVDGAETFQQLRDFVNSLGDRQRDEVAFIRRERVDLLVADVPFLAGYVAAQTGLPCLAISNFTWDWIFEPILAEFETDNVCRQAIRQGYSHMRTFLRLPFGHGSSLFERVVELPLVATRSDEPESDILAALDLRPDDPRRRVLVARRGGFSDEAVQTAAKTGSDFVFLFMRGVSGDLPHNVRQLSPATDLVFEDLLSVSDAVISKLGYSTLAACAAADTAILYPPRSGFREDEILVPESARYLKTRKIALDDYEAGNWLEGLNALRTMPSPPERLQPDGARACVDLIAKALREK